MGAPVSASLLPAGPSTDACCSLSWAKLCARPWGPREGGHREESHESVTGTQGAWFSGGGHCHAGGHEDFSEKETF